MLPDVTPLRASRSFRLLWTGQLISQIGNQLRVVAVPYQIYLLTGSPLSVGLVGLFQALPLVTLSLFGGVIADFIDRRRLLVVTQVGLAMTSVALAIGTQAGVGTPMYYYALVSVAAAFTAFDGPARSSLVPNLVERRDLAAAIALNQIVTQTASIAGPALAGVIVVALGVSGAFWINSVTFAASISAVLAMRVPARAPAPRPNVIRSLLEGLDYVRRTPTLKVVFGLDFVAMFFGTSRALFPFFADRVFHVGPEGLGLLYAAPGVGAFAAAITSGWIPRVHRQGRVVLLAAGEACDAISAIFRSTMVQTTVPDSYRGRLNSVFIMFALTGPLLGQVQSGAVASVSSPQVAVIYGGIVCLLAVAVVALRMPRFAAYDARDPRGDGSAA